MTNTGDSEPRDIPAQDQAIPVLAAVVSRHGRYLICRRPARKRHGGLWEFPGGKIEPGESLVAAAKREMGEELGVSVVGVGSPLFERLDSGAPFRIVFVPIEIVGTPRPLEHDDLRWATVPELRKLPLAPADERFVVEWLELHGGREMDSP